MLSIDQSLPNLVIEVAFSETREHARRKAEFWLGAAAGTLQAVILIIIDEAEARRRPPSDGSGGEVPGTDDLESDDDQWVGNLHISVEVWRSGFNGVYRQREMVFLASLFLIPPSCLLLSTYFVLTNQCVQHLADVTALDSAQDRVARAAAYNDSDDDESASDIDDDSGPTFILELSDFFGPHRLPRSRNPHERFVMRTDTLRSYITKYRRLLGRNRRATARSQARAREGEDRPYVGQA